MTKSFNNTYKIIDFHTHILPNMDDGSDSVDTSIKMIEEAKEMGITSFVATSHFYALNEEPDSFLNRRETSFRLLKEELEKRGMNDIDIRLGCEVAYFPGIGRSDEIKKLTINNSSYILIEMPFHKWNEEIIRDIEEIKQHLGLNPILAHVNRYFHLGFKKYYERLAYRDGFLFQWNGEVFSEKRDRKLLLKFCEENLINLLGSDMHNLSTRKENLDSAISFLLDFNPAILDRIEGLEEFIIR